MTQHELKCEQPYFQALWTGHKNFEVRKDDRGFQPGDTLLLRECWVDEFGAHYTGREVDRTITYVLRDGLQFGVLDGYVVLGLSAWNEKWPTPSRRDLSQPGQFSENPLVQRQLRASAPQPAPASSETPHAKGP